MRGLFATWFLVVAAAALAVGGGPGAAEPGGPAAVTVLSRAEVGAYAVVTTGDGTVVAVWERATARRTRVVAAVRPAGANCDGYRSGAQSISSSVAAALCPCTRPLAIRTPSARRRR